ncbi:hypothetical protein CHS0354_037762 [Potamilus streckersoni]|uniref:Protrudin n=1 Tax=Potamilus streckersoni TaxID=2493646 RepID=A0AAE0W7F8_9BIVA|nr:hypothetical protein CHS0354_037762 [Potamilus streckersoni]
MEVNNSSHCDGNKPVTVTTNDLDNERQMNGRIDLADFVQEVERFNKLVEPFAFVIYAWDDLRRWRYPMLTFILWIVCNIGCFFLTQGAVFALVAFLVILIATTCLFQLHTHILDKFLPETSLRRRDSDSEADEGTVLQTVREFRYSLMQMHDFIVKCNDYLNHFYAILKWEVTTPALRFFIELCGFLLCLVVMPVRWNFLIFTNWFFLASEDVYHLLYSYFLLLMECAQGKRTLSSLFQKPVDKTQDKEEENEENYKSDEIKEKPDAADKDDFSDVECDTLIIDGGDSDMKVQTSKPGMVAKLIEMKRRRQRLANESCFGCKVSFSSILKTRHYCRHCGNNFCSKCCNQKVPKATFGATAPTAQTDTVLVCTTCYNVLMQQKDHDKA